MNVLKRDEVTSGEFTDDDQKCGPLAYVDSYLSFYDLPFPPSKCIFNGSSSMCLQKLHHKSPGPHLQ